MKSILLIAMLAMVSTMSFAASNNNKGKQKAQTVKINKKGKKFIWEPFTSIKGSKSSKKKKALLPDFDRI